MIDTVAVAEYKEGKLCAASLSNAVKLGDKPILGN